MNQNKAEWASLEQRQKFVQEITTYRSQFGNPTSNDRSSVEIEAQIYQKAQSREEYMNLIARLLIHLKDVMGAPNNMGNVAPSQKGIVPPVVNAGLAQQLVGHDDQTQIQIQGQPRVQMLQVSTAQLQQPQVLQTNTGMTALSKAGMQKLMTSAGTIHLGTQLPAGNVSFVTNPQRLQVGGQLSGLNMNPASTASYQPQFKQIQQRKTQAERLQNQQTQQQGRQQQQQNPQQHIRGVSNQSPSVGQGATATPQTQYSVPTQKGHPSPSPSQVHQAYASRSDPSPLSNTGPVAQSPLPTQPSPSPAAATPGNPPSLGGPVQSPLDASDESAYAEKLKELAKYIEPLRSLINKMPKDGEHAIKRKKLVHIDEVFSNKRRVSLAFLAKCEQVVHTLLSADTMTTVKPGILQAVTDHLVPLSTNPSLVTAAQRCIDPVLKALSAPTIRHPKPPRKRRRPSSDDDDDDDDNSNLPDALQMEIAHLWSRFSFDLDPDSRMDTAFFTLSCKSKKPGIPSIPPLVIKVPACYPKRTPEYSSSSAENSDSLLLDEVRKNFLARLLESQKEQFHSVTYILEAWEQSLMETLNA